MGASGWIYFVPYQDDVNAALQKLRDEVFRRGEYAQVTQDDVPSWAVNRVMKSLGGENSFLGQLFRAQLDLRRSQPRTKPQTIDELLEQSEDNGTHSILDMVGVSAQPQFQYLTPLPMKLAQQLFGTDQPARPLVEANETALFEAVEERWTGFYFTVYREDRADELCFVGVSGD